MATALLVVDMQNVFTPMTTAALPNILKLISFFQSESRPSLLTQHGHSKEELTPPFKNQLVRKWGASGSIATGSKDWELQPEIAKVAEGSPIVAKNTYDALLLRHNGEECIQSRIRDMARRGCVWERK